MEPKTLTIFLTMNLFAALAIPVRPAAQEQTNEEHHVKHHQYELVDIGTFGGPASYINAAFALGAVNQINEHGTSVGSSATSEPAPPGSNPANCGGIDGKIDFVFHAFKWENGAVTDLGALPGDDNCSVATSINANGEIAGSSEIDIIDPLTGLKEFRAVLWKDGKIRNLGTLCPAARSSAWLRSPPRSWRRRPPSCPSASPSRPTTPAPSGTPRWK